MKQQTESNIQQEIFIFAHNTWPNLIIHSVPNGLSLPLPSKEMSRVLSQMKNLGMVSGISDLMLHLPGGKVIMIEVKLPNGKQSEAQIKIENKLKAMGGNYILVRSLEDFKEQIQQYL